MKSNDNYSDVIAKTTAMVQDKAVQRLAAKHGLQVLDVTWEDSARYDSSAVGQAITLSRRSGGTSSGSGTSRTPARPACRR